MPRITPRFDPFIIFFGTFFIFIAGVTDQDFINFQTRFAVFAQEMLRNGPSFFPTTYNIPYPDYPATSTFLVYLASLLFGRVLSFSLVLPTAITSALIAVMTYQVGALQARRLGWYGVFFLLFTASFLTESRTVALDQYVSLITVTAFYLVYSADIYHKPPRWALLAGLLVLGFLFRGPIGLVVPASIVGGYYLLNKQYSRVFRFGLFAFFLLALCFALLLGLAYWEGGKSFLDEVIQMQVASRVRVITHNPWSHYFFNCLADYAISYPLALLVLIGVYFSRKSLQQENPAQYRLLMHLIFWLFTILIGFSFANSKRNHYVLPMAPALALICGYLFTITETHLPFFLSKIKQGFLFLCRLLPGLCALLILAALFYAKQRHLVVEAPVMLAIGLCLGLQMIILLATTTSLRQPLTLLCALGAFLVIHILIVEPVMLTLNKTRPVVVAIEQLRAKNQVQLGFYAFGRDAAAIKFMSNLPPHEIAQGVEPLFLEEIEAVLALNTKTYFITYPEIYDNLPNNIKAQLTVLQRAQIGHINILIFIPTRYLGENDVLSFR